MDNTLAIDHLHSAVLVLSSLAVVFVVDVVTSTVSVGAFVASRNFAAAYWPSRGTRHVIGVGGAGIPTPRAFSIKPPWG